MTRPEEDVEIGATASPAVGAIGATSDVSQAELLKLLKTKSYVFINLPWSLGYLHVLQH
jgi:hypothetical protein